jgi:hypothetical protein
MCKLTVLCALHSQRKHEARRLVRQEAMSLCGVCSIALKSSFTLLYAVMELIILFPRNNGFVFRVNEPATTKLEEMLGKCS